MTTNLIGQGNYGCVYDPPIPCNDRDNSDLQTQKMVSKVMSSHNAEHEFEQYKIFSTISKKEFSAISDFCIIPEKQPCTFDKEKYKESIKNCEPIYGEQDIVLINQINGGISLNNYIPILLKFMYDEPGNLIHLQKLIEFLKAFSKLIEGLIVLRNTGIIHMDIKPDNIVYNEELKKCYFIDFGCSTRVPLLTSKKGVLSVDELSNYIQGGWDVHPGQSVHWPYEYCIISGNANNSLIKSLKLSNIYPALNEYNLMNIGKLPKEHFPDYDEYEENLMTFLRNIAIGHDLWGLVFALSSLSNFIIRILKKIASKNDKYKSLLDNFIEYYDYLNNHSKININDRIGPHKHNNNKDIKKLLKAHTNLIKNLNTYVMKFDLPISNTGLYTDAIHSSKSLSSSKSITPTKRTYCGISLVSNMLKFTCKRKSKGKKHKTQKRKNKRKNKK